jgi:hypothetical protein
VCRYTTASTSVRPLVAIVGDYTWFDQDAASLAQVGEQNDTRDLRALRLGWFSGPKPLGLGLFLATDFQEKRTREDDVSTVRLSLRHPPRPVKMYVGKQKEPFVYELVSLSVRLRREAYSFALFVTRSSGAVHGPARRRPHDLGRRLVQRLAGQDLGFHDNANDYVGRITALPFASADNRNYLHLGLGIRRVGDDAGQMRFSGRPESNVADKYVDTGNFAANYARQLSLEAVWSHGPVMLSAEHVDAWVDAPKAATRISAAPTSWPAGPSPVKAGCTTAPSGTPAALVPTAAPAHSSW